MDCFNYKHISKLELAGLDDISSEVTVGFLIGVDYYFSFFVNKVIKNYVDQLLAKLFRVGPFPVSSLFSNCLTVEETLEENYDLKQLHRFWDIENMKYFVECFIHKFKKDIVYNGERCCL